MRIREEDRNMVLLATVTLFAAAIAGAVTLLAPPSAPAQTTPAYLADNTSVRVIGGAPFVPNVNPREHR